jgi:ribosomal RNA-processing protein 12
MRRANCQKILSVHVTFQNFRSDHGMEDALAKIRPHTASKLAHQKTPAALLHALEATFREQDTEQLPTAYFAALLTTLDGTVQKNDRGFEDGDTLPAELYLLALVSPFVSPQIIRAQLDTLLSLTAPLFPLLNSHAPPLRSQLTLYYNVFLALDRSCLEVQGIRQAFTSVLQLCVDSRPKVRKRAADLVKDVLAAPPPPLLQHPYADRVAVWLKSSLTELQSDVSAKAKGSKRPDTPVADAAIHLLAFLRPIATYLPPEVRTRRHF